MKKLLVILFFVCLFSYCGCNPNNRTNTDELVNIRDLNISKDAQEIQETLNTDIDLLSDIEDVLLKYDIEKETQKIDASTGNLIDIVEEINEEAKDIEKNVGEVREDISEIKNIKETVEKDINNKLDEIENKAQNIQILSTQANNPIDQIDKTMDIVKGKVKSLVNNASVKVGQIKIDLEKTIKKAEEITEKGKIAEENIQKLADERNQAVKEKKIAEEKAEADNRKIMRRVMLGCFGLIGLSVFAGILISPRMGAAGTAAGLVVLFFAITFNQHLILISWIGLGIIVVLVIGLLVYGFIQKKDMLKKDKALEETVETAELAKYIMEKNEREKIFGKKNETGFAGDIQSDTTKKLVKEKKKKMPAFWQIIKDERRAEDS
jgi:hypothetical protein